MKAGQQARLWVISPIARDGHETCSGNRIGRGGCGYFHFGVIRKKTNGRGSCSGDGK